MFPFPLTLTLGWGKVEVPPGRSREDSLGNSKKNKKNKRFFSQVSNGVLLHWNPKCTSGNVCPTLVVWGVPTMCFNLIWLTSGGGPGGNVDPNSWWWWCWVLVSDTGADVVLYLVEPVFLQLQVVHHVLEMGVGAGMIGWTLFAQVLDGAS